MLLGCRVGEAVALWLLRRVPDLPTAGWCPMWQALLDARSGALEGGEVAMLFAYYRPAEYVPGLTQEVFNWRPRTQRS